MSLDHSRDHGKGVKDVDMQQVVEKGYASKHDDLFSEFIEGPFCQCEEEQGRADGHQDILQRGRIFGDVEKGQDGVNAVFLCSPGAGVAVVIDYTEEQEGGDEAQAETEHDLFTTVGRH